MNFPPDDTTEAEQHTTLAKSIALVNAMTPAERDAMVKRQIEGIAKAEMSWPKPKFHYENGVKVYDSYEDYCND